ncbi:MULTISPECIES: S24 family peptidase [Acinetobacter]|uniref:S24 family peptidase n=1 Tax=Acinetobacter TaxID=469 RepID=UPI001F4A351F|nr:MULTISPECIES: S24 family peptidase [Acinetobacter]MCH7379351.1 helix-turn-helix domain-containing protein [Acinetobacter higginsii]
MKTVADRIVSRMRELGLRHADLMKGTGAGKATVSNWISGTVNPSAKYWEALADTLKTTPTWLLTGEMNDTRPTLDGSVELNPLATVIYAPVLSWVQAGNFTEMGVVNIQECEMLPLVPNAGKRSFYLEVKGLSNAPYFEEGEKICIDPDYFLADIQTGEMVVVKCGTEATFKALVVETNGYYLKPLNPNWKDQIIPLTEDCILVGKYVGSFKPAKKFNFLI